MAAKKKISAAADMSKDPKAKVPDTPAPAYVAFMATVTGDKPVPKDLTEWVRERREAKEVSHLVPADDVYNGGPATFEGEKEWPVFIGAPFLNPDNCEDVALRVYDGKRTDSVEKKQEGATDVPFIRIGSDESCKVGVFLRGDVYAAVQR